jgi:hypothetical protein
MNPLENVLETPPVETLEPMKAALVAAAASMVGTSL